MRQIRVWRIILIFCSRGWSLWLDAPARASYCCGLYAALNSGCCFEYPTLTARVAKLKSGRCRH